MKVVHLNTFDIKGGAARAAHRLHQGLIEVGVDSEMFVRTKETEHPSVIRYELATGLADRLRRLWRREKISRAYRPYKTTRPDGLDLFSDDRSEYGSHVVDECPSADVYNFHWISAFVDLPSFLTQTQRPVVWTLHDMNAFTGGCHYNVGCSKYQSRCGACPQLGSNQNEDLARDIWDRKRRLYEQAVKEDRLHIVTPSTWLADEAKRSTLLGNAPITVIPNGLDTDTYQPRDTTGMKHTLSIPSDHSVVLFVASSTRVKRKGFSYLKQALDTVEAPVTLVSIGAHNPEFSPSVSHIHLGSIESPLLMSCFYSLADIFAIPSLQDNLPNTVLESMACGTPVLAFDVGGISDMVRPGKTGWLVEKEDTDALRASIETAVSDPSTLDAYQRTCRNTTVNEYSTNVQTEKYLSLYESI